MSGKEPTSIRLVFSLAISGLLAGVALSWVYSITLPMIQENQAKVIKKAIYQVLPRYHFI